MAMSLSADDEDYDSDSEQVSTLKPCRQAGTVRPPEERTQRRAASQGSEEMEPPGEKCTHSVSARSLIFSLLCCFLIGSLFVCNARVFLSGATSSRSRLVFIQLRARGLRLVVSEQWGRGMGFQADAEDEFLTV